MSQTYMKFLTDRQTDGQTPDKT